MSIKIAIVGNIASGKSVAEKILSKYFTVFYSDAITHEILDSLTEFYGLDVFTNNKIDRLKLGKLVFSDSDIKNKLEKLLHPMIKNKIIEIFKQYENEDVIFVSVPLLFEAGFEDIFDKILFISADENIRLKRLISRNNLSEGDAKKRINAQESETQKLNKSDFVIYNNSTVEEFEKQILIFIRELHSLVHFKNTENKE